MGIVAAAICVLMTPPEPQAANPFAGKALLIGPGRSRVETDVRIARIGSIDFLVFAPFEVDDGKRVIPRRQLWRPLSALPRLMVYADTQAAEAVARKERKRLRELNPKNTEPTITRYPQPVDRPSVEGRPIVVTGGREYFFPNATIQKVGNQAFFVFKLGEGREQWLNVSTVEYIEVYDSVRDAEVTIRDNVERSK